MKRASVVCAAILGCLAANGCAGDPIDENTGQASLALAPAAQPAAPATENLGFAALIRDDREAIDLTTRFFNTRNDALVKLANGERVNRTVFRTGASTSENLTTLLSKLSGYSLDLAAIRVTKLDKLSCTTDIAEEIRGKVRYGNERLGFILSRRTGLVLEKPSDDDCTCSPERLRKEMQLIDQAMSAAAKDYCKEKKIACHGNVSNYVFGDAGSLSFGVLSGHKIFQVIAGVAGVDAQSTEDAIDIGVRCQNVTEGVLSRALQTLRDNDFACLRLASTLVIDKGKSFSNVLNGNHIFPTVVPFHFMPFQSSSVNIGVSTSAFGPLPSVVTSDTSTTPADPTRSSQLTSVMVDYYDPWQSVNATSRTVSNPRGTKDVMNITPYPMGGKCELKLALARGEDKTRERPFDPFCYASKFPGYGAPTMKGKALDLDREYYCDPAAGTGAPYVAKCPDGKEPPIGGNDGGAPPSPEPDNLCPDAVEALPPCTDTGFPSVDSPLVQSAVANANECFNDTRYGGANICLLPADRVFRGATPCSYQTTGDLSGVGDYSSVYYTVPGECHDLSGAAVPYCSVAARIKAPGACPYIPPPPPSGDAGVVACEGRRCP